MTTRYFSFTDGERTYFRATKTRAYTQGNPADRYGMLSYSASPNLRPGWHPTTEVTKAEYDRFTAIKNKRVARWSRFAPGPQDSWI
jgi:hypothetical protein